MKRLTHGFSAYLRLMQMSRSPVFVFVEGKQIDPYFYGKMSRSALAQASIVPVLEKADILSGQQGGKQILLSFHDYLKRKSALLGEFQGKKTAVIFYLDKDVDDLRRIQRHSPHLVYTTYYDVYNHLFVEGDIAQALAAAASLDPEFVGSHLGNCQTVRRRLSALWKEWVGLCLYSAKKKINCRPNYRLTSRVNRPACGPLHAGTYASHVQEVRAAVSLTDRGFRRSFSRVARLVDNAYANGTEDTVFKGKWYPFLFAQHVAALNIGGDCDGVEDRMPYCLLLTIDFDAKWADWFKNPLRRLVSAMGT